MDLRFRLLRAIEAEPDLSQRQLAKRMGLSLGKVNYCIKAMTALGWVKPEIARGSANRLGYWYRLTPSGLAEKAEITPQVLKRKLAENTALTQEIRSIQREVQAGGREGEPSRS